MPTMNSSNWPSGERSWRARQTLVLVCVVYIAMLLLVHWSVSRHWVTGTARAYIGFLPSLLFLVLIVVLVQSVRSIGDEMMKRIHMQAATFAFVVTALVMTFMDGLAHAGLWNAPRTDLELAAALSWAGAILFLGRRYQC